MSNAAPRATGTGNKFVKSHDPPRNPTTKLLAEGLAALAEAIRELDDQVESLRRMTNRE